MVKLDPHYIIKGFYKRAAEHGITYTQATLLFKQADAMQDYVDNVPKPSTGIPTPPTPNFNWRLGLRGTIYSRPTTSSPATPATPTIADNFGQFFPPGAAPSDEEVKGYYPQASSLFDKFKKVKEKSYLEKIINPNNLTLRQSPAEQNLFNRAVGAAPEHVRDEASEQMQQAVVRSPQAHAEMAWLTSRLIPNGRLPLIKGLGAGIGKANLIGNLGIGAFSEAMDAKPGYFQEHMKQQNVPLFGLEHANAALQNSIRPVASLANASSTLYDIANTGMDIGKSQVKNTISNSKLMFKKLLK